MRSLEFIIKKLKKNQSNSVNLQEIHSLLGLQQLEADLKELKKLLEGKVDITKETLLELLKEEVVLKGQPYNITNAANIEKNSKIKNGTIYYNSTKDCIRFKKKEGWISINI